MSDAGCNFRNTVATVLTLITGTISAMSNKLAYQTNAVGLDGVNHDFKKACLFTVLMFIGEALCLPYFYFDKKVLQKYPACADGNTSDDEKALLDGNAAHEFLADPNAQYKPKPPIWFYAILCIFDLTATTLNNVGTIYVSASAVQMLRGSSVLFTGISTILILKRRLNRGQWSGIGVVILALLMVGVSVTLREHYSPPDPSEHPATGAEVVIGIVLILLGSFLNSVQNVFEEKLLKGGDYCEVDPLEVVGWEGIFGTIFSAFILLPIAQAIPGSDANSFENTTDTFLMLKHSPIIVLYCVMFAVSLGLMNNFSQVLSKNLSAIVRMLVSTCRVVMVWITGLIIYSKDASLGENWDHWSWLQLGGFVVLVGGTMMYVKAAGAPPREDPIEHERIPVNSA